MPAEYTFDALDGADFVVDLWPPGRHLSLHLSYEPESILESRPREALTVAISRDERLLLLDQYGDVLGGLGHFVRDPDNEE